MSRKDFVTIVTLVLFVALMATSGGCGGETKPMEITEADASKGVEIEIGEQFDFVLDANETTGFSWELVEPKDDRVVKKVKNEYVEPNTGTVGAGGKDHWVFEGVRAGEVTIKLEYVRPWEPDAAPDKTIELKVTVKE